MRVVEISVAALLLCGYPQPGRADWFYELLRYRCEPSLQRIEVEYVGAYNEEGQRLFSSRTPDDVNLRELVVMEEGDEPKMITQLKSVEKRCVLQGEEFQIELGPDPCNYNVQGRNGGMMMGYAQVRSRGRVVAKTTFGACTIKGFVRTKLVVRSGKVPTIVRKSAGEYFR